MAKMIDAEKLWLAVRDDPNITGKQFVAIKEHILGAKTVDAVEVVRCKNCRAYNTFGCADGFGWCGLYDRGMMDNCFCSNGGRKVEDGK